MSLTPRPKVVLSGPIMPEARKKIEDACDVKAWDNPSPVPRDVLFNMMADADGLLAVNTTLVDAELIARAPRLKVIAQPAVGYDNVDVAACTARRIPFGNTPGVLVETTAELAFGLMLAAARRIHESWLWVREGNWRPGAAMPLGLDLFGHTLGIVGMGRIGAAVARRAVASGMRVIYHNRNPRPDDERTGASHRPFHSLLAEADFVLVLTPLTEDTRGLFGPTEFARMKPTAHFINAARGAVVDTDALVDALRRGIIAYAALDVTEPEPPPPDHPLLRLPNVLITPHVGSATHETRNRMALLAADNLLAGLDDRPLPACVNPEVYRHNR